MQCAWIIPKLPHQPQSTENCSHGNLVPGAKKVGDCCLCAVCLQLTQVRFTFYLLTDNGHIDITLHYLKVYSLMTWYLFISPLWEWSQFLPPIPYNIAAIQFTFHMLESPCSLLLVTLDKELSLRLGRYTSNEECILPSFLPSQIPSFLLRYLLSLCWSEQW